MGGTQQNDAANAPGLQPEQRVSRGGYGAGIQIAGMGHHQKFRRIWVGYRGRHSQPVLYLVRKSFRSIGIELTRHGGWSTKRSVMQHGAGPKRWA